MRKTWIFPPATGFWVFFLSCFVLCVWFLKDCNQLGTVSQCLQLSLRGHPCPVGIIQIELYCVIIQCHEELDVEHTLPASRDLVDTEVAASERGGKMS